MILLVPATEVPEAARVSQDYDSHGLEVPAIEMGDLKFWMPDVVPLFVMSEGTARSILHGADFTFNG